MKGTILPRFFPSGGSGPTQLLSWPPALPGGSESPPTPSEWGYVTVHPKAPRWGVHARPPCPDGHPTARFGQRLTWHVIWD